jgi:hypothetical protein
MGARQGEVAMKKELWIIEFNGFVNHVRLAPPYPLDALEI